MKRRLTQSIAGLLLVCMAGSTIFGAASGTRKGAPKPEPTTTSSPSTGMPGKAPTKEPSKAPAMPSSPSAPSKTPEPSKAPTMPVAPSEKPSTPVTPIAPKPPVAKPVAPSEKPNTPVTPIAPKPPVNKPVAPSEKPSSKPSEKPSSKPSTCPNKPATCPNKPATCPNKQKPFTLDNFKVIQATLASCGVDEQELAQYIKQGKKLEDVLKAENISVRKFKKRVLKEYCKVVNEAVKSGQLTNEQGAQLKEAIKDTVKNWLPKK